MRASVILLLCSLAGILGGAALIDLTGLAVLGGAVIFDAAAVGIFALLRDAPAQPAVRAVPGSVSSVLERYRAAS